MQDPAFAAAQAQNPMHGAETCVQASAMSVQAPAIVVQTAETRDHVAEKVGSPAK